MDYAEVEIERPVREDADRLQMLFQWSRTRLGMPPQPLRIADREAEFLVSGFLVTVPIPTPPGERSTFLAAWADRGARVHVPYVGERPRLLGSTWLGPLDPDVDERAELEHWLSARRRIAKYDAAHAFFLELDEKTLVPFLLDPTNDAAQKATHGILFDRLLARALGTSIPVLGDDAMEDFDRFSGILTDAMKKHFAGSEERMGSAMDRFAAGWLREYCELRDGRIGDTLTISGDADSANIFMFAEFALAMHEQGRTACCVSWMRHLKHFVRMQAIYLSRWGNSPPDNFGEYTVTAPVLQGSLRDIQAKFDQIGENEAGLADRMRSHLQVVFRGRAHGPAT